MNNERAAQITRNPKSNALTHNLLLGLQMASEDGNPLQGDAKI